MENLTKYKTFQDLKDNYFNNLTNKKKGDNFELLTKYYLLIDPIYQTKLKNVWLLNETPVKIKNYLNLPNNDEGIDLIAETKNNEYWAIQCKYRTENNSSITREDISTFLDVSANICKNISHKLVCTTANKQSYKFEKLYDDKITFLLSDTWNNLNENFFNQLQLFVENKPINIKPFQPRKHQNRAIKNASNHFIENDNSRGKLIMACGSGKSLTAYWIAQKLESKNILIAVPSLALIKQTLEVWTRESIANHIDINWLAVCSDETVSEIDNDVFTSSTKDLGIDVSTDIDYISNWLENSKIKNSINVIFTTYQSGRIISESSRKANIHFDFGIMDEAHKTVGLKNTLFSHLLFDENISISKRLFMTATERRYKGNSDNIISMDNIEIYGEDFEILTFKEALESNPPILSDYKIIAIVVTKSEISELIENNNYIKPENEDYNREIESEMLASTVALHKAIKKYNIKHTISFHSSIKRSKIFKSQEVIFRKSFKEYTDLDTFHISGNTPTATRNKIINTFAKADNSLITNARCLTEGVDVPNIDCVMFADPKQSTVDIVQATGRALRLAKNKKFGYVLVPILIDDDNIDIENIKNRSFQAIITILRALASSDSRIIDYFQDIDSDVKSKEYNKLINFDIPVGIKINLQEFNDAIKLSIVSKLKKLQWQPFEEARGFVRKLGLKTKSEWTKYCRNELDGYEPKPSDMPTSPNTVYKFQGWIDTKDWLGTKNDIEYLSFEKAREFSRKLGLKNQTEWKKYCTGTIEIIGIKPDNIPKNPEIIYRRSGWKNYKNWLNKPNLSFETAKKFVKDLNLQNKEEWLIYCKGEMPHLPKLPSNIFQNPNQKYGRWKGWDDFLNVDNAKINGKWRSFEQAREFARSLKLAGQIEWKKYVKGELDGYEPRPNDIPTSPYSAYKNKGWIDFGDWLGTGRRRRGNNSEDNNTWLPYKEAKEFVHKLKLSGFEEWQKYINGELENTPLKPTNIPNTPIFVYKDKGWINWNDWLGRGKTKVKNALPFEEAREFVRSLGLKNTADWIAYKKGKLTHLEPIPNNIPKSPLGIYKNKGWIGMLDWLGVKANKKGKV